MGVGALPSENVAILIKKYGTNGTHVAAQKAALEKLAAPKSVPDPGAPASLPKPKKTKEELAAEAAAAAEPKAEEAVPAAEGAAAESA
jgi:small subunit ribosomal protein S16